MAIVSSQISHNQDRGNGSRSVHEIHTDHVGVVHDHRYQAALDFDADAALAGNAAKIAQSLIEGEKERVFAEVEAGADPATITVDHITNKQALRQIVRAAMNMSAEAVITAAKFIDKLTDAQLDNVFNAAIRTRIRNRVAGVLALKASLDADAAKREEL